MVTEAIIIIILIAVISGVFLREKRYDYAKSTGVLLIMPLAYLFGFALSRPIATLKQVERIDVILVAIIIGLMISCILLGLRCISIKQKKLKLAYLIVNGAFIGIISLIFIYDTLTLFVK